MQNKLAGTKPNCPVRTAMTEMITLLMAATIQPDQCLRPTMMVDTIVRMQEM